MAVDLKAATPDTTVPGGAVLFGADSQSASAPSVYPLTNVRGAIVPVAVSTEVSGLGTGVATALGVAVGSAGAPVVNGGALGTPSSGTLTNATGLPISSGVSGLGTGVATALAVNVGTAGAPVINGGALGTPSSGNLTNCTLPSASYISKTGAYNAVAGDNIVADTSGGAFTINLPSSPSAGNTVLIIDGKGCFGSKNLTVGRNGSKINALSNNDAILDVDGTSALFTYIDSTYGWVVSGYGTGGCVTTKWDPGNVATTTAAAIVPFAPNYRRVIGMGTANNSIRSNRSIGSGKVYAEFLYENIQGGNCIVGCGVDSATVKNGYPGNAANSYGITANALAYTGGSNSGSGTACANGDILGILLDFTPSTGSVKFYKNNSLSYAWTGLTLSGPYFLYVCASTLGSRGILSTTAAECTYTPAAGYSFWDS